MVRDRDDRLQVLRLRGVAIGQQKRMRVEEPPSGGSSCLRGSPSCAPLWDTVAEGAKRSMEMEMREAGKIRPVMVGRESAAC